MFPYTKKEWYQGTVLAKYKVGGVPVITIAGVVGVVSEIYTIAMYTWPLASVGWAAAPLSVLALPLSYVFFVAVYYYSRWYRKRRGINIGLAFKQLPPE